MINLVYRIASRLNYEEVEVSSIEVKDNKVVIDDIFIIEHLGEEDKYNYALKVDTSIESDSKLQGFREDYLSLDGATGALVKEIKKSRQFQIGNIVEKDGKYYMLVPGFVPIEKYPNTFRLLDLDTNELDLTLEDKISLYKKGYTVVNSYLDVQKGGNGND